VARKLDLGGLDRVMLALLDLDLLFLGRPEPQRDRGAILAAPSAEHGARDPVWRSVVIVAALTEIPFDEHVD